MSADRPIVMAFTGASGAPYGVRLLQALVQAERRVSLIISSHGLRLLQTETSLTSVAGLREHVGGAAWDQWVTVYDDSDRGAGPASGSHRASAMVICPCCLQ